MKLYSYVVALDFGFAPNPYFGCCTLATCKPLIRRAASPGDWVVGLGSKGNKLGGRLVFAMKVAEAMTYDEYWNDPRFRNKRPFMAGSLKQVYGDNIYHRKTRGGWHQEDSHHSLPNGKPNPLNVNHDTQTDRVLVSPTFVYYGGSPPPVPGKFAPFVRTGENLRECHRGHRVFSHALASAFERWFIKRAERGYLAEPFEHRHKRRAA